MSPDPINKRPVSIWPDLGSIKSFSDLPYQHARLNILEIESRVMERYLRSQRDTQSVREKMDGYYAALSHFLEQAALVTAMHLMETTDNRLIDEYRYYQDLDLELNRLVFQAFKGLLTQDSIYDLGQAFGKTNLLALYNLGLLADEADTDLAKQEYRLTLQFKKRYFADKPLERTAVHSLQINPFVYFEPDYSASDFLWIEDDLARELQQIRLAITEQERQENFSALSNRRLGILDHSATELQAARDTIAHWLVPIASYDRNRKSLNSSGDINHLYPHPVSTVKLNEDLPDPIWGEDLAELAQIWGDRERNPNEGIYSYPLSSSFIEMIEETFSPEMAESLQTLQERGYIRSTKRDQSISLWLPQSKLPFTLMERLNRSQDIGTGIYMLGHSLASLTTREDQQIALRLAPKDFQQAKAAAFFALVLDRIPQLYENPVAAKSVRDAYLLKLLNQTIYSAMVDELQDFIYSQAYDAKAIGEYWLYLLERWYPDLADKHEWLLAQEQSWRQIPALIVAPYQSTVEFTTQLFALRMWDLAKDDFGRAKKAYTSFIQAKRSASLSEALDAASLKSVYDIDGIKRLAYQISVALDI